LIEGLNEALSVTDRSEIHPGEVSIDVVTDSKLVVEQVNGRWKVKHTGLKPLHATACDLLRRFGNSDLSWPPHAKTVRVFGH
jgi:ribonuclease HI